MNIINVLIYTTSVSFQIIYVILIIYIVPWNNLNSKMIIVDWSIDYWLRNVQGQIFRACSVWEQFPKYIKMYIEMRKESDNQGNCFLCYNLTLPHWEGTPYPLPSNVMDSFVSLARPFGSVNSTQSQLTWITDISRLKSRIHRFQVSKKLFMYYLFVLFM